MFDRKIIADPNKIVEQLVRFTDAYRMHAEDPYAREVACLRIQYPLWMEQISSGDMFAGKGEYDQAFGLSPQPACSSMGWFFNEEAATYLLNHPDLQVTGKLFLESLMQFWKPEDTAVKIRRGYPPEMARALPSDNWTGEPGIAFPLYRMSGTQIDFDRLMHLGVVGLHAALDKHLENATDAEKRTFYAGAKDALEVFAGVCLHYADMAASLAENNTDYNQAQDLKAMAGTLRKISSAPPGSLREAIQLSFLYAQFCGSINYGRMDDYLGDFLATDLESGLLDEESAIEMLCRYWQTIDARGRVFDSRLTIGGRGRRNENHADGFALIAMEAMRRTRTVTPQITLRFYSGQNPALMEKALDVLASGVTYPMLYNDDVNIPSVAHAFNLPAHEAVNYVPFGCGEYTIYHKSVGTPSGVINMLQALLVTLNNGNDPKSGIPAGLALGEAGSFHTFGELFSAYKKQIEYFTEQLAFQEALEYKLAGEASPFLLISLLYEDCLKKGKPIFGGGVRYLGGTLETYGNTNTADSLLAIKQLVYNEKRITLSGLRDILLANFERHPEVRQWCLEAPKFGNDHDEADAMRVEVDRHICEYTRSMKDKAGLHHYLVVIINNNANTVLGRHTAASPDGRQAFSFMANANAPSGGMDRNGLTALLNSMAKPDVNIHAGAVQNLKLSNGLFRNHRKKLEALLNTWFDIGGAQLMITVLNRNDLEMAMKEPQNYQHLTVRVGGYSARFIDLPRDVQMEVLSRTLY